MNVQENSHLANGTDPEENSTAENHFTAAYQPVYGSVSVPLLLTLSVVGTCENLLLIAIIVRTKKLHQPSNFYVLSASVNDIVCCLTAVNGVSVTYANNGWPLGFALCSIWLLFNYWTGMIPILHVTLIAWDRHEAIVQPLKYSSPNKNLRVGVSVASTYIVSLSVTLALVIAYTTTGPNGLCYISTTSASWALIVFTAVIPIVLVIFFFFRCVIALQLQMRKLHPRVTKITVTQQQQQQQQQSTSDVNGKIATSMTSSNRFGENTSFAQVSEEAPVGQPSVALKVNDTIGQALTDDDPDNEHQQQRDQRNLRTETVATEATSKSPREHQKPVVIMTAILSCLLFLVLPSVCCSIKSLINKLPTCTTTVLDDVIYCAPFLHTIANPIILIAAQKDFREVFKIMFS